MDEHNLNSENKNSKDEETYTVSKLTLWKSATFILAGILVIGGFFAFADNGTPTGAVVGAPIPTAPTPTAPAPSQVQVSIDDDAILGDPDAPVAIIEFSDYECPFCARFHQETLPQIKSQYIDTGKVKLVYRDFPLSFHPKAQPSAEATECFRDQKGDEGYYEFHDKIFQNQGLLSEASLKQWAVELGANEQEFADCVSSGKFRSEVLKDFTDGQTAGIQGTPGFIIMSEDGTTRSISGAQPFAAFDSVLKAAGA